MSKSIFSGITIAFLVAGLIVGVGGGYFAATSSLQPKIDDYQKQVTNLNTQITSKNNMITLLNSTLEGLRTEINGYKTQVQTLQTENSDVRAQVQSLQVESTKKDEEITKLNSDLLIANSKMVGLEKQLKEIKNTFNTTEGYIGHYMYGFSFAYPQNMTISIGGFLDNTANANSGKVSGENTKQGFVIMYSHMVTVPNLDVSLDSAFTTLESQGTTVKGAKVTSTIQSHVMKYQSAKWTFSGTIYEVIYAYWYCSESQRFMGVSYVTLSSMETINGFNHFIETVKCHYENEV
jgi:prefoldin subunit 5